MQLVFIGTEIMKNYKVLLTNISYEYWNESDWIHFYWMECLYVTLNGMPLNSMLLMEPKLIQGYIEMNYSEINGIEWILSDFFLCLIESCWLQCYIELNPTD